MNEPNLNKLQSALVVCGKFHFFNYAADLSDRGVLRQFIYSHRIRKPHQFKGRGGFINIFLKEYLLQAHSRLLGERFANQLHPLFHRQWDLSVAALLKPVHIMHFLMHGNLKYSLRRAKKFGTKCIGEAVNSHPVDYLRILAEEHADLQLDGKAPRPKFVYSILDEIPQTDAILVPSDFVRNSYLRNGVSARMMRKIPYGANLVEFIPSLQKPEKFRVICVAQVALRKGHQYLLRAWKQLNFPDAELHCYGLIVPEVLNALNKIKAPNVYFHGSVGKAELIRALQGSAAFVLASVEEGFAVSVLEGLACGLPVIATDATGAEGVITSGKNGLLAVSGNVEQLCVNLEKLYQDTELRRHLGAGARELVETRYNWTSYVEELIRFYDVVLADINLE